MKLNRRDFLSLAAGGLALSYLASVGRANSRGSARFKAVAFDAFPIFDPRPIFVLAEELFPGRGAELGNLWRVRQFEYTWLRTLAQRYADFHQTTSDALRFAAESLQLDLPAAAHDRLMDAYFHLKAWPDTKPALDTLKSAGVRLGFLSNFTAAMLESNIESAGLHGYFEHVLSTDEAGAFKPDPRAYQLAPKTFGLSKEEIVFAAFAGWDAAGAKAFGFPTFWVNRQNAPAEKLGATPDAMGSIADLARFVTGAS